MDEAKLGGDPNSVWEAFDLWRSLSIEGAGNLEPLWLLPLVFLVTTIVSCVWAYRFGMSWKLAGFVAVAALVAAVLRLGNYVPMLIKGEGMDYTHPALILSFAAYFCVSTLEIALFSLAFVGIALLVRKFVKRVPENTPV